MRFYTRQHRFYCGVDLHARSMYVCVLDQEGNVLVSKDIPTAPEVFLKLIAPYREDCAAAAECMFTWYWLADLCAREGFVFVLGHALYMRAIHGGKAKNDRIDAHKIAALLRGGMLPQAYVYPQAMRATRDLIRPDQNDHPEMVMPQLLDRVRLNILGIDQYDIGPHFGSPTRRLTFEFRGAPPIGGASPATKG